MLQNQEITLTQRLKVRRIAMKSVLTSKVQEGEMIVVDKLAFEAPKTKDFVKMLSGVKADSKTLVVLADNDKNTICSGRNVDGVKFTSANTLNVYDILKYNTLLVTKDALDIIQEVYN